jgi:hypothetical protein
LVYWWAARRAV